VSASSDRNLGKCPDRKQHTLGDCIRADYQQTLLLLVCVSWSGQPRNGVYIRRL